MPNFNGSAAAVVVLSTGAVVEGAAVVDDWAWVVVLACAWVVPVVDVVEPDCEIQ
jgi:hypothetical protein